MATLFQATGTTTTLLPTTSWAAPNALFPTTDRNDGSAYTWTSSTSTVTLPASGLADGYLFLWGYEFEDSSNGRHNPQGKMVQASGTGNFESAFTAGYNRDNSEDRSYVSGWSFVDNPSASSTFQFQWKRDADTPTGGTVRSFLQVVPFYYSDIGLYSSTTAALYGGTTPNLMTGFSGTDGTNITITSNQVSVTGDNKRYLILGSGFMENHGGTRTQRWYGLEIDGTFDDSAKGCMYLRNSSNDEGGESFIKMIETATATRTIEMNCYRGDGVGAGQGGADVDGSTPTVGAHALVVIELNDSAEVFASVDSVGGQEFALTGPVDVDIASTGDIEFNDSASFTRSTDTAVNVEQDMDVFAFANISHAREASSIGSGSRWTVHGEFTINGTEQTGVGFHGNYNRGNQTSADCHGSSTNQAGFFAVNTGQDVGVSNQELAGTEGGAGDIETQPGWVGFGLINLDTLEAAGATITASGTPSISEITASGTAENVKVPAGTPTLDEITASGTALIGPLVWLNTTETTVGADAMTVTAWSDVSITFSDPVGGKKGDLFLGVENGAGQVGWIAVRVSVRDATGTPTLEAVIADGNAVVGGVIDANGTPSLEIITTAATAELTHKATSTASTEEITASGAVQITRKASAAPQLVAIAASATALLIHPVTGTPSLDEIEASGTATAQATVTASGTPSLVEFDATGTATLRHKATSTAQTEEIEATSVVNRSYSVTGTPSIVEVDSAGNAVVRHLATGTPSLAELTASGTTNLGYSAIGSPSIDEITSSGLTTIAGTIIATGSPDIAEITASGDALVSHAASGTPTIIEVDASGTATITGAPVTASGTPSIPEITVSAESNRPRVWLNTTETKSGATEMSVTAWSATSITFDDPVGEPTGSLWLGVENVVSGDLGWIAVTVNAIVKTASGTPAINELTVSAIANVLFGNEGTPSLDEITVSADAVVRHIATGTPSIEEIDVVSLGTVTPPQIKTAIGTASIDEVTASSIVNRSYQVTGTPETPEFEASSVVNRSYQVTGAPSIQPVEAFGETGGPTGIPPSGGHFIPGLAGVKAGKKRPWEKAKEEAEEIIEDVIREVLEDDTKPVKRVSRKRKNRIIELATEEIQRQEILLGDLFALERAVDLLSKALLQQRLKTLPEEGPRPLIIPDTPLVLPDPPDQELARVAFDMLSQEFPDIDPNEIALAESMLNASDPDEDELLLIIQMLMSI